MTFLLILVAIVGWLCAFLFVVLFTLAGLSLGVLNQQLNEAQQDLEVYRNTANVFNRNSQGRFKN
jgi:hypothetical protein